jgi:hypothetical protein
MVAWVMVVVAWVVVAWVVAGGGEGAWGAT